MSCGDIFKGAPAVDAIVSPANSFGFMDGGIDMVGTFAETFSSVTKSGKMSWGRREYSTNFVYREAPLKVPFIDILLTNGTPFTYLL